MRVRMGGGSRVYELVPDWGQLPSGVTFGYTHGVVVDSEDRVYVHNRSRDAVVVFDRDGRFLHSWGEEFTDGAHGMFLSREPEGEFLYLADPERHLVAKATLEGRVLWRLAAPDLPDVYKTPDAYRPTDVCVAPNGDFYVADGYGQSWVHQYDRSGRRIRSWGGAGSDPGRLQCPHGLWVDTRGTPRLLVADRGNRRLQAFTLDGQHLGFIRSELRQPCCLYQHGDELVIPDLHARVTILGRDDQPVCQLGDDPGVWERPGWPNIPVGERRPGQFIAPHAACVDSRGDIYVVEWVADGRLTKLRRL